MNRLLCWLFGHRISTNDVPHILDAHNRNKIARIVCPRCHQITEIKP